MALKTLNNTTCIASPLDSINYKHYLIHERDDDREGTISSQLFDPMVLSAVYSITVN